jgi:hypothetical protein
MSFFISDLLFFYYHLCDCQIRVILHYTRKISTCIDSIKSTVFWVISDIRICIVKFIPWIRWTILSPWFDFVGYGILLIFNGEKIPSKRHWMFFHSQQFIYFQIYHPSKQIVLSHMRYISKFKPTNFSLFFSVVFLK